MYIEHATELLICAFKWIAEGEKDKLDKLFGILTDDEWIKYMEENTYYRGVAHSGELDDTLIASWSPDLEIAKKFTYERNPYIKDEDRKLWVFEGFAFKLYQLIQDLYDWETIDWFIVFKEIAVKTDKEFASWWEILKVEKECIAPFFPNTQKRIK